jgi:hypothetical protein
MSYKVIWDSELPIDSKRSMAGDNEMLDGVWRSHLSLTVSFPQIVFPKLVDYKWCITWLQSYSDNFDGHRVKLSQTIAIYSNMPKTLQERDKENQRAYYVARPGRRWQGKYFASSGDDPSAW